MSIPVYDGLVAMSAASGSQVLVPDLARWLPEPTHGDTVYTFRLRPGITYSDGQPIHASDFALAVRRALDHGANPGFYVGIKGAAACAEPSRPVRPVGRSPRLTTRWEP